jgi:hypothetical protein
MADAYSHPNGWNDYVNFPTDPANEAAARALLQEQHDEILDFHNTHMASKSPHPNVPSCRVYHSIAQSIPDSTFTSLAFDTEKFDNDTMHDVAVDNNRITIKTAGRYLILATATFDSNATGYRQIAIRINASTKKIGIHPVVNGAYTMLNTFMPTEFIVGDYLDVLVWQNSGGALDVISGEIYTTFSVIRVG